MSVSMTFNVGHEELIEFIGEEIAKDTGLPVRPFSVVRNAIGAFNGMIGICDDVGCLYENGPHLWTAWGQNNWAPMLAALRRCGVRVTFVD